MLAHQYEVWRAYQEALKAQVEILIVDDGSDAPAIDVPRPAGLPPVRIWTFEKAAPGIPPWRQDAARNRAAHEAHGSWLFLSDMDHVLPTESLSVLLGLCPPADVVYSFQRLDAPDLTPKVDAQGRLHPHPNTYAMRKDRYWKLGGYDEEYCGIYGTDGYFRRHLLETTTIAHLDDVPIVRFPREVIPDASTPGGKEVRDKSRNNPLVQNRIAEKRANREPVKVLIVPCEQQYPVPA